MERSMHRKIPPHRPGVTPIPDNRNAAAGSHGRFRARHDRIIRPMALRQAKAFRRSPADRIPE
jgi:hypothetical protein